MRPCASLKRRLLTSPPSETRRPVANVSTSATPLDTCYDVLANDRCPTYPAPREAGVAITLPNRHNEARSGTVFIAFSATVLIDPSGSPQIPSTLRGSIREHEYSP